MYGELATGSCLAGRPALCYKGVCKRDLKAYENNPTGLCRALQTAAAGGKPSTRRAEERDDERGAVGGEKRTQTAEGSMSACRARHGLRSGQGLPFQDRPVQPQQALQFHKRLKLWRILRCLPRQSEANNNKFPTKVNR